MKVLTKISCAALMVAVFSGCASDSAYVPKLPPGAQAQLVDYADLPGNKAFVVAVDPNGDYAFGFDYGLETIEEAAKSAYEQCVISAEDSGVLGTPYVYALNDDVVYEQFVGAGGKAADKREGQKEEFQKMQGEAAE